MNVLLVIPTLGQGGAQRVLVNLANSLASFVTGKGSDEQSERKSFSVSIVTFTSADMIPHHKPHTQVDVYYTGVISGSRMKASGLFFNIWKLRGVIAQVKPDVVVAFQDIANFPTILACFNLNIPLIVSERQDTRFYSFSFVRRFLRWFLYRRVDRVVVQTELVKSQMPLAILPRTVVIPNPGPDNNVCLSGYDRPLQYCEIISVGRLEYQKNFSLLVDAAAIALQRNEKWSLTIYGEGSLRGSLEKQIDDLGMSSRIRLPGVTSKIFERMFHAQVFVLPSRYEGFPNVLAEASSFGLACVAYADVSGVPEIIVANENGILLGREQRNPGDLSKAILELMNDVDLRDSMGRAGVAMGRRFEPGNLIEIWVQLILSVR